jgi:membrane protein DedA with SNARE-associated domain
MMNLVHWGYWGVFLLMMLENLIPPIPSEAIMSIGGIAVAKGQMNFVLLVLAGTAGTVVGNLFWWEIGRRLGYERLKPIFDKWGRWLTMDWEDVERLRAYFDRWGGPTVLVFRFMPVGRTLISIPAGLMHMPFWRFVGYTAAGSAVWNVFLVGIGYALGAGLSDVERWVNPAVIAIAAGIVLLYIWRVLTWKSRH